MRASLLTLAISIYYLLECEVPKYTVRIVFISQFLRGIRKASENNDNENKSDYLIVLYYLNPRWSPVMRSSNLALINLKP